MVKFFFVFFFCLLKGIQRRGGARWKDGGSRACVCATAVAAVDDDDEVSMQFQYIVEG